MQLSSRRAALLLVIIINTITIYQNNKKYSTTSKLLRNSKQMRAAMRSRHARVLALDYDDVVLILPDAGVSCSSGCYVTKAFTLASPDTLLGLK